VCSVARRLPRHGRLSRLQGHLTETTGARAVLHEKAFDMSLAAIAGGVVMLVMMSIVCVIEWRAWRHSRDSGDELFSPVNPRGTLHVAPKYG
jgi:hypothetical protein